MTECQVMELIGLQMEQYIKVNGKITSNVDLECMNFLMGLYMKENGSIILCMGLASSSIIQEENGQDNLEKEFLKQKIKSSFSKKRR